MVMSEKAKDVLFKQMCNLYGKANQRVSRWFGFRTVSYPSESEILFMNETQLNNTVYSEKDVIKSIKDAASIVISYLIDIYLFFNRSNADYERWKFIVFEQINCVPRLKETGEYPNEYLLYNEMCNVLDEVFFNMRDTLTVSTVATYNNIKDFCNSYILWLSKEISKIGMVTKDAIYSQIDGLLKRFHRGTLQNCH